MDDIALDQAIEHLEVAQAAFEVGDLVRAERAAKAGIDVLEGCDDDEARELTTEGELTLVSVYTELREDESALEALARVHQLAPDDPEAVYLEARLRILRWELDDAERLLGEFRPPEDLRGVVLYHRAILAELARRHDEAESLYAEAAHLDPDGCPRPVRIDDDEARAMLSELAHSFPDDVRKALDNVRIDILDVPEAAVDGSPDTDPLLLGIYHGVPISEAGNAAFEMPAMVRIFKRNIERLAADREHLMEQLRITLLHEVGHHLGWDEDDLAKRGLA